MCAIPAILFAWPDLLPASFFAAPLADPVEPADAIVFLGGDICHRERKSLALLAQGKGRFLLVTGEDNFTLRRLENLLPPERWAVETAAASTWDNARFSFPLLRARGARSAILVTDWWHSRRALACFQRACPGIRFDVVAARPPGVDLPLLSIDARRRECLARLWYALRYGVW